MRVDRMKPQVMLAQLQTSVLDRQYETSVKPHLGCTKRRLELGHGHLSVTLSDKEYLTFLDNCLSTNVPDGTTVSLTHDVNVIIPTLPLRNCSLTLALGPTLPQLDSGRSSSLFSPVHSTFQKPLDRHQLPQLDRGSLPPQ